jgi:hypothetical protein
VLYQLLTGERAFSGSATVVMQQILNQMPPPVSTFNPALDTVFDAIVARALAKQPEHRYATARLFLDALQDRTAAGNGPSPGAGSVMQAPFAIADEEDDRTMLAVRPGPGTFVPAPVPGSFGDDFGAAVDTGTQTPWKLAALPDLETLLTHQIGPMARLLLKKAASQAGDLDALCAALLPHIPSERGRQQFALETGRLRQRLDAASAPADHSNATRSPTSDPGDAAGALPAKAAPVEATGYDQAYADATQRRLAVAVGPIARVLVSRTAQRSTVRDEFLQLLAQHIESASERDAFLRDMAAMVAP